MILELKHLNLIYYEYKWVYWNIGNNLKLSIAADTTAFLENFLFYTLQVVNGQNVNFGFGRKEKILRWIIRNFREKKWSHLLELYTLHTTHRNEGTITSSGDCLSDILPKFISICHFVKVESLMSVNEWKHRLFASLKLGCVHKVRNSLREEGWSGRSATVHKTFTDFIYFCVTGGTGGGF